MKRKAFLALLVVGIISISAIGQYTQTKADTIINTKEHYILQAKVDNKSRISTKGIGKLGDIIIEEMIPGSLSKETELVITISKDRKIEFKSPVMDQLGNITSISIEGEGAYIGQKIKADIVYNKEDQTKLIIQLDNKNLTTTKDASKLGSLRIKGLEIQPINKNEKIEKGEVYLKVQGKEVEERNLLVASVRGRGMYAEVAEEIQVIAGKEEQLVHVTLYEDAPGSIGKFVGVNCQLRGAQIVQGTVKPDDPKDKIDERLDGYGNVKFFISTYNFDPEKANSITFSFKISASLGQVGDITLKIDSKSFQDGLDTYLGEVVEPVNINTEKMYLKSGRKDQIGGEIILSEAIENSMEDGKEVVLTAGSGEDGLKITGATVMLDGEKVKQVEYIDGKLIITVDREKDELATLVIGNVVVTVDSLVPTNGYSLMVSGSALSKDSKERIEIKNFFDVAY